MKSQHGLDAEVERSNKGCEAQSVSEGSKV